MLRHTAILFLLICIGVNAIAQEIPHFVEKLSTDEGLSGNNINDIAQDDQGFLWIATTDGLNRYDGIEVIKYFHKENQNSPSHDFIYCLKKLPGNRMAIGTQAGLDFYDGNTGMFSHYYYQSDSPLNEFNNVFADLMIDSRGNLWAASRNCIYIFNQKQELVHRIPSPYKHLEETNERLKYVTKMFPLDNGNVLLYLSIGLKIYDASSKQLVDLEKSQYKDRLRFLYDFLTPRTVRLDKYFAAANTFQVFNKFFLSVKPGADSLLVIDENGKQVSSASFPFNSYPYILWSQKVATIDSTHLLFLFHNYGLAIIPVTWNNNLPVIHAASPMAFESQEFSQAIKDRQGNWWLATTEEGLQKISPPKQNFNSLTLLEDSSGRKIKYDVSEIRRYADKLWVATYGSGFFEVDPVTGKHKQFLLLAKPYDQWANFIWNIRHVNKDTLWIGTQAGLFWFSIISHRYGRLPAYYNKPSALDSVPITIQYRDSHGLVWMGLGRGHGICYFNTATKTFTVFPPRTANGYPLRYPTSVAEDDHSNLWFVSDASPTLIYWRRDKNSFETIPISTGPQKQHTNLSGILYDNDSTIYLGAFSGGLIRFNPMNRSVKIYDRERGLTNSHISNIFRDVQDRIWVVTDGELACLDQHTELFTGYFEKDGLPVKYPTASFYYDSASKLLYNGGNAKVFFFDPDKMTPAGMPPKTLITAIQVNGKPMMLDADKTPRFKSWENDITIQYTAVDLTNGAKTRFAYKLLGEDSTWMIAGNQRQINFSRLAPGDYTFLVRAGTMSGVWSNEVASINFKINLPFTQTIWFYLLVLFGLTAVFYTFYRMRISQLVRTEEIRSEISKNLHDEVGATLSNISLSSLLAQKQIHKDADVGKLLDRIYHDSQSVSESMREIVWSINPKIDTIGEALPRMVHYASELLDTKDIELRADISSDIEKLRLGMHERRDIYLIFKEALNNLAKHSGAKKATISFHLQNKSFVMMIEDNGKGFCQNDSYVSNGLKNMQERAERHHWKLAIDSAPGKGTTITLKAQIA